MNNEDLDKKAREVALQNGADLIGVVRASDLPEHAESIARILPTSKSVVVVAARHSLAAISSTNNQVAQHDTIYAYDESARAAHKTARFLESEGFPAVAVPAFIPIDMAGPNKGMRGEICWRRAGVRAGLGSYGENGLLITPEFRAAIRISGVVTSAELQPDPPAKEDACDHCMRCVEACPVGALSGEGRINKKLCGEEIFKYGFRYFASLVKNLAGGETTGNEEVFEGHGLRELWQTFMTGNYYYCFRCQSQCPATKLPNNNR
jgi:epoxyqueuosine reductase QueG